MFDRNCIGTSLENNFLVNSAFSVTIFSITKSLLFLSIYAWKIERLFRIERLV